MAKSFNLELQTRPTRQGTYPVWIRITEDRKHRRIKTSIELNKISDWNPKGKPDGKVRKSEPHYQQWNDTLASELNSVEAACKENKELTLDSVVDAIKEGDKSHPESFMDYAKEKVEESRASQSIGTYKHYKCVLNKLQGYLDSKNKTDLSFSEVNVQFVKSFKAYLGEAENQRNFGRTLDEVTISSNLKKLRKLVFEAVADGKIDSDKCPFGKGKLAIAASTQSKKEKLEADELCRIMALDLEKGGMEWHTRNAFLFSFYCAGIRVGDLMQLRWENIDGGVLSYQMDKNGKLVDYSLPADALKILDCYKDGRCLPSDYIFPFLDSKAAWAVESHKGSKTMNQDLKNELFNQIASKNVLINRSLKVIALKAKVHKKVTFHTSRHTFAYLGMKSNLSPAMMKKLLKHSSVKTTEVYMGSFNNQEESKAIDKVVNQLHPKDAKKGSKEAILEGLKGLDKETLVSLLTEALTKE